LGEYDTVAAAFLSVGTNDIKLMSLMGTAQIVQFLLGFVVVLSFASCA